MATMSSLVGSSSTPVPPQGRLTLSTGVAVTTADVTAATIYYTPYIGRSVPLYNGSSFSNTDIGGELSQANTDATKSPLAVANSSVYDLFVWSDSGTIRCTRGPAWTNDTTRGYTLTLTNGIYLNTSSITNGPAALRGTFVGTVRSDGSAQCNDTAAFRGVWNTYNRARRPVAITDATASWEYHTTTMRQARATAANRIELVRGLDLDAVSLRVAVSVQETSQATHAAIVGIGLDSTTTNSAQLVVRGAQGVVNIRSNPAAFYEGFPGVGYHALNWLEKPITAGSSMNWFGTNSPEVSGMSGEVWA